ncbi:MAG: STAS domain-containing protein [Acaryochloridaceae cyanobacterium SU_2_1]|nr:STAS domain-containing protein [Acaryochloridaceae cyanobacterium SU_2_1]NJM95691.1 STAS domain-containing protein [Acaryochloridaceae cyanobacterium CSU_5_19]
MSSTVIVLQPQNLLDGATSEILRQEINLALSQGADIILIDCQQLSYMDSSGLGSLVLALKSVREASCRLALCSLCPQVAFLFELTNTDQVFDIYVNRQAFDNHLQAT